jgi:hypothetical protein
MPGRVLHELHGLWQRRDRRDEYLGTLINAYLEAGGRARGVHAGRAYVDVGTLNGYRAAIELLRDHPELEDGLHLSADQLLLSLAAGGWRA